MFIADLLQMAFGFTIFCALVLRGMLSKSVRKCDPLEEHNGADDGDFGGTMSTQQQKVSTAFKCRIVRAKLVHIVALYVRQARCVCVTPWDNPRLSGDLRLN